MARGLSNEQDGPNQPGRRDPHGEASLQPGKTSATGSMASEPQRLDPSRLTSSMAPPSASPPSSSIGAALLTRPNLDSRRSSVVSVAQIDQMISDDRINMDTYGVSEMRDGFFDALFLKPSPLAPGEVIERSKAALPREFDKSHPLSPKDFLPRQLHELRSVVRRVTTTRAGIKLLKTVTAFLISYILCLIPVVRNWLGRYDYIIVVSVILNHPGRTFGSQVDGAIFTILGTASGLAWGVVGLLLSTSTIAASAGYGGILTVFLALFMASVAIIRALYLRLYQAALAAGLAVAFTTLAETNGRDIEFSKLWSYGLPWLLGQAVAFVVNVLVFPNAGNRPLTAALDKSFRTMQEALIIPRPKNRRLRRRLTKTFMDMATAYRDMRIDITITRFRPTDVRELRNLVQGVVRALLSMNTETLLFDDWDLGDQPVEITVGGPGVGPSIEAPDSSEDGTQSFSEAEDVSRKVANALSNPTKEVLACMAESMRRCHAALMDLSGCRSYFGPPKDVSSDIPDIQVRLQSALAALDIAESSLLVSNDIPETYADQSETLELFVFARHARETAASIVKLNTKVHEMHLNSDRMRVNFPTYSFWKSVYSTNAQVRHDRGGATAGIYQATFAEISHMLEAMKAKESHSEPRPSYEAVTRVENIPYTIEPSIRGHPASRRDKLGYKIWTILRRMQGFESRYALKVAILISILSIPAWSTSNSEWWDRFEAWWGVCIGWIMMHPRVGGNVQDLVMRAFAAILGAVWSGAAYAAGNGNPFVMAAFAAIYMVPMLFRYTQSSHPRSGLVGCLSFTVISLGLRDQSDASSAALLAMHMGLVFFVSTSTAIVLNSLLWAFGARRELRFALSSMLFFMSVMYRNVVANYVYFDEGEDPTPEDITRSEILESRMRQGFSHVRELLVMTRHELRLRAPFDPLPYSALAGACERFFEYLIAVRQSALFYNPNYIRDNPVAAEKLLSYRRDAVASILGNLYILAGALRSQRKVPRYLPSAAAARKKLLLKAAEVAREMAENVEDQELERQKTWSDIYSYSYNESLTGCVAQLEDLEKFAKVIVGEKAFEGNFKDVDDSDEEPDISSNEKR
ncbi:Zinc finger protein containing five transmembrane domains [Neonectria punicea]|uniref:Zinc finger protein containing five transmembrane domains n=1 Tax=Neonectria punicea TaxID=979145 RepID=A0ABR1HDD4_9HYPO